MTTHNFTRRRLVLAMVSAAAVILASCAGTTGSASAAENAAETLLSRNASYTLAAEGFMYVGQVQPGVNLRPKEAKWVETPLVEGTDTGDLLIDGKTDPASVVYTPWYWSSQVKQITVAMTLPGRSRVSRVVVVFPEEPVMRAEAATLFVKTEGGVEEIATERTRERGHEPGNGASHACVRPREHGVAGNKSGGDGGPAAVWNRRTRGLW